MENSININKTQNLHCKVLILGAGLSGIAAGKTLLENGVDDFIILEGQDYIGGRIKQTSFGGYKIEEGANWIQCAKEEDAQQIWKLKNKKQVEGAWTNYYDLKIRNEKGQDVTNADDIQQIRATFDEMLEIYPENLSARDGLKSLGWDPQTPAQNALDYLFTNYEYARDPEKFQLNDYFIPESEFFVTDQRGVMCIFEDLVEEIGERRIKLNRKVEKIVYSSTGVEVTTSDDEVYTSDYCLCTFSTGVLASNMVQFVPPLPQWKQDAISKAPMTVYTKIFLKFDKKFWDDNEYILFAAEKRGYYTVLQDLENKFPPGSGLLLITVTEDEGRRIEQQSFDQTKAEIVDVLRGVYGPHIPEPTDIFYPRWHTNPFIRGAYSEPLVGCTSDNFELLGRNLHNLYFAGEATSDWHGYMQGAYLTGQDKGRTIAKLVKSSLEIMKPTTDIVNSSLDIDQSLLNIDQLSLDILKPSIDIIKPSIDIDQSSLDIVNSTLDSHMESGLTGGQILKSG